MRHTFLLLAILNVLYKSYGHVAVVDGVDGNNITISEWNFGGCSISTCDLVCGVTDDYKKTKVRPIPISSVTRFWRPENWIVNNPDGGITHYHGDHTHYESYLDPNHKHAISMDDTELSIRGQGW